jgi:small conductance mechanosensitive channel
MIAGESQNVYKSIQLVIFASCYLLAQSFSAASAQDSSVAVAPEALAEAAPETLPEAAPEALPEEIAAQFDQQLADIDLQRSDIATLETRAAGREGIMAEILLTRRDRLWTSMFKNTVELAKQVVAERDLGKDVSAYWDPLAAELEVLPNDVEAALGRVAERAVFATADLSTMDYVVADQKFFRELKEQDHLFKSMIAYTDIAEAFGLDAASARSFVITEVSDQAANLSAFLAIAQDDFDMVRATIQTLPDHAEVSEWQAVAATRIRLASDALEESIQIMSDFDLETGRYQKQLLATTGEITTDVLDVGIISGLVIQWTSVAGDLIVSEGPRVLFRGVLVLLILIAFWQLAKLMQKLAEKALSSSRVHMSNLLRRMILVTIRNIVVLAGVLIAVSQIGISLAPVLAGLGIAGFIIGIALQDTLSNFASGVMILLYRPFDVGDIVNASGVQGKVSHMSLVNTTFLTLDNQRMVVPNNLIWGAVITNVTAQQVRRIDLMFGISYDDDIVKAEKVLQQIVDDHELVLDEPETAIKLHELADSSVNIIVRPWVKTEDYWDTYWDLMRSVKLRFDEEGISIPFPQRDVHVKEPGSLK